MRICYISDVDISLPNGPGVNEREFVVSLSGKLGNDAIFIMPKINSEIGWHPQEVHFYPKVSWSLLSKSNLQMLVYSLRQIAEFRKVVKKESVDLVVFRLNYNSVLCAIYLGLRKQPYAIKTLGHKGVIKKEQSSKFIRSVFWKMLFSVFNRAVREAVAIDVCTDQYFEYYSRLLPKAKLQIVENSVNPKRFYPKNKAEMKAKLGLARFDKLVGYVGGSPSKRGVAQLVELSPDIRNFHADCGIVVVGHDREINQLKRRAKELDTEGSFMWAGTVPYEVVTDYINSLDVGIALDTADRVKNIGNSSQKIRQYLACGVPVICPKGTNSFVEKENLGILVDCHDLRELLSAIKKYLSFSNSEAQAFSGRATKFVHENLSSEVAMESRLEFWERALEGCS